ncbi:hypothetical protein ACFLUR_01575 [Chloroflexota bacterium]
MDGRAICVTNRNKNEIEGRHLQHFVTFFTIVITVVIVASFWLAIFITYHYLHEFAGHYPVNWLSGVSPEQIEILWYKSNNLKIYPLAIDIIGVAVSEVSIISRFSGGFMVGVVLAILSVVIWKFYMTKKKWNYFRFFAITLGFAYAGFAESIIEGFFLKYHRGTI